MTASLRSLLQLLPWSPHGADASPTSKARPCRVRTSSTMRVRAFSADLAARALLELLPVPELRAHVLSFLAGPLEWTNMAVAARFGRLALLQALAEARDRQPRPANAVSEQQWAARVRCPPESADMALAHGHTAAERWLQVYMASSTKM